MFEQLRYSIKELATRRVEANKAIEMSELLREDLRDRQETVMRLRKQIAYLRQQMHGYKVLAKQAEEKLDAIRKGKETQTAASATLQQIADTLSQRGEHKTYSQTCRFTGFSKEPQPMNTPTAAEQNNLSALDIINEMKRIQDERGKEYGAAQGERSMPAMVVAFNAITGQNLSESEGWMFMMILKMVRERSNKPHRDSCIDMCNYGTLYAESRLKETPAAKPVFDADPLEMGPDYVPPEFQRAYSYNEMMKLLGKVKERHGTEAARTVMEFGNGGVFAKAADIDPKNYHNVMRLANFVLDLGDM